MHTLPSPTDAFRRFWPALLGFALVYALWPLLWLGLNSAALNRQEPNAAELFSAAPAVYFTGKPKHFQTGSAGGRYLLRDAEQIRPLLLNQGWQFTEQMGAGYFFEKDGRRAVAICKMFSRYFSVCNVSQI
ncbi:MAG: hypothetical protein Q4C89_08435 [Deinococcus sp.]|uniref:hypothetical protein n=1 Tax=Deinococcus sp. TaxID=47478 RepID=UPI0026DD6140|nr:hypothetical protein [Deinococcus sp.]MDO4246034.1 hypothetical protein [Deinococcus sp.]